MSEAEAGAVREMAGAATPPIHVLPNGVDLTRFAPAGRDAAVAARSRWGVGPDACVVGTVGMLRGEKNQGRLIRAFARAARGRDASLLLVGDREHCRG